MWWIATVTASAVKHFGPVSIIALAMPFQALFVVTAMIIKANMTRIIPTAAISASFTIIPGKRPLFYPRRLHLAAHTEPAKYKDYNYASTQGRYQRGTSLDDMEQRNLQWGNSYRIGRGMVSAGIDRQEQRLVSHDDYASDRYKRINTGYYLTGQQAFNDVTLEAALRGDDNNQFGWNTTRQTAVGWTFTPGYRATLSYATAFQAPTLGQMYGQQRLYIVASPDLKAEKSKQWEVGLEGLTGPVDWRLSAYQNKIDNLIDYFYNGSTFRALITIYNRQQSVA